MRRSAIVDRPLDPASLLAEVSSESCGATVLFLGSVRNASQGRNVTGIEYRGYRPMAERELAAILAEVSAPDHRLRLVVEHRLGSLALGEISVVIAAAHPHRDTAYQASRAVIEELKRRVPIWKREMFADGTREWADARIGEPATAPPAEASDSPRPRRGEAAP
jgi:molybdopterin synthase catalytic subunit